MFQSTYNGPFKSISVRNPMAQSDIDRNGESDAFRDFTRSLLNDLRALEEVIRLGLLESDARRFGAEQEVFIVDRRWRPAPIALKLLEQLNDPHFSTELALFNAEINIDPQGLGGNCFSELEGELNNLLNRLRTVANGEGADIVMTGILPSLSKSDLSMDNMTPHPRYYALNEAMTRARGGPMRLHIEAIDELHLEHDSVMLEACNTSFQVHLQVGAEEFAHFYNIAQTIAAPVLAAAVNSPLLFGKRLWRETRIAVFQQSVDTRTASPHLRELSPRVRFGERWITDSVIEAFQEDVARFKVILAGETDEDPFAVLERGGVPQLRALQLHNSTIYRWNRPCYGLRSGSPHLRIECRALPAGPSVVDEVANAAFWIGLMLGMAQEHGDITNQLTFDEVRANFLAAARQGPKGIFTWIGGKSRNVPELILADLLPLAGEGLRSADVSDSDIERFLGVIRNRMETGRTGATWLVESYSSMRDATRAESGAALTAAMANRQRSGIPGHEWQPATLAEGGGWRPGYVQVEQYMTTELFTVGEDELVEFAAFLMDQRYLRHVLVEDHDHQLVGIVSYRSLIRLLSRGELGKDQTTIAVKDVMERNPITVTPETSTVDAIDVMRAKRVSALPVCKNGKLVGLVTERSFMNVTAELLKEKLRGESEHSR
jgi:CBS domain-containing protein/gamma-glutamylcysteine synthetase